MLVRVVRADHRSVSEIVMEVENEPVLSLSDTTSVNILEAEILVSTVRKRKSDKHLI